MFALSTQCVGWRDRRVVRRVSSPRTKATEVLAAQIQIGPILTNSLTSFSRWRGPTIGEIQPGKSELPIFADTAYTFMGDEWMDAFFTGKKKKRSCSTCEQETDHWELTNKSTEWRPLGHQDSTGMQCSNSIKCKNHPSKSTTQFAHNGQTPVCEDCVPTSAGDEGRRSSLRR